MRFRVIVLPGAESDITDAADWIAQYSPIAAARWLEGMRAAINTLSEMPLRCPVAADDFGRDAVVRQLFYGPPQSVPHPVHGQRKHGLRPARATRRARRSATLLRERDNPGVLMSRIDRSLAEGLGGTTP